MGQSTAVLAEGDRVGDKYLVGEVLGRGGMGVVRSARHLDLEAPRAIKLPIVDEERRDAIAERFVREARIGAKLSGEHVVRVYDSGTLADGTPYIVLERLEGVDLAELVRHRTIAIDDAVRYVLDACDAMAEAHALGIVHLDLKPANLFLTARHDGSSCVKVLDFGVARAGDHSDRGDTPRVVEGSPSYMAPEQVLGRHDVGPRSDVWSLGVILYELVTGRLPFRGPTAAATLLGVVSRDPESPCALRPDLPSGLAAIIARCLRKRPEHRFESVSALRRELLAFARRAGDGERASTSRELAVESARNATTRQIAVEARLDRTGSTTSAEPSRAEIASVETASSEVSEVAPVRVAPPEAVAPGAWSSIKTATLSAGAAQDPVQALVSFGLVVLRRYAERPVRRMLRAGGAARGAEVTMRSAS